MKKIITLGGLSALVVLLAYFAFRVNTGAGEAYQNNVSPYASSTQEVSQLLEQTDKKEQQTKNMNSVVLHTSKGNITLLLSENTPKTTENFIKLASSGFYDGIRFHRVIEGFMIQAGDPLSKDLSQKAAWGTGGPGYDFADELTGQETYIQGTLAMANRGPNTNGSQFFIVTAKNAQLPAKYTVFGKVTSGLETVLSIESTPTDQSDRPLEDIVITKVEVKQ
jgi:cyclophilin family peptidyl-prolyl cis-trans isomerase